MSGEDLRTILRQHKAALKQTGDFGWALYNETLDAMQRQEAERARREEDRKKPDQQ